MTYLKTTVLPDITQTLLAAKKARKLSFADLEPIVGLDEVCIAAIIYRQATAASDEAQKLTEALGLGPEAASELTEYNVKGFGPVVPTDPFGYRFYEIMQVYGLPLKSVIQEKFGDGIMSAIDFTMRVEKEADPKATG